MATINQEVSVSAWTPINMWAMLRALINNGCPILTINGVLFPITSGIGGTFSGQAGPGSLLIDYANTAFYQNTGTLISPLWSSFIPITQLTNQILVNGAISPSLTADYVITKPSALLSTLAAPTTNGVEVLITSSTPYPHVISAIGLLQTGTAAQNYITFPSYAGGEVDLLAFNGKWIVINSQAVTFQ